MKIRRLLPRFGVLGPSTSLAFFAAVLITMVGGRQILLGRDAALRHAEAETRTLARTLAEHAERTIKTVDLSLSTIVDQVQGGRDPKAIAEYFRGTGTLEQLHNLAITDETGRWLADTAPPHPEVNSADRPYFLWFTTHADRGLYFAPMVIGRTSGARGFPISRRINHADGSFAGVAVATFAPEYFADFYRSVRIGGQGTISLWASDGSMLVRYPELLGRAPQGPVADAARTFAGGPSGLFRSRSPWDGVERLFGFEHVGNYPIVVSVGLSIADALTQWRHEATMEGGVIAGAALALVVLGITMERRRRRMLVIEAASLRLERGKAEAEARFRHEIAEANRLLRLAEEIAQSGHWRLELPSNRLTWSDQVYRIHGRDPALFSPTLDTAIAHYHPDDRLEVERFVGQAIAAGRNFQHGLRIVRADGTVRHVLSRGLCQIDPGGGLTAIFGTFMDVTELRQAEEALATSEARYRSLVEDQSEMISLANLDGTLRFVNPAYARVHGLTPDEMVGRSLFEFVPAAARQSVEADWRKTAVVPECVSKENEIVLPDGTTRWIAWTNRALTDGKGRATAIHSVGRDIEERVAAERSLRESEARYRLLADNATDMVTHMDLTGRRLFVSPASRDLLGYTPDELVDTRPQDMIHPDDAGGLRAVFDDLAQGRRERAVNVNRLRHRDGRWIWVEASLKVVRGDEGRPSGFVGTIRDITDRRLADEALRESETRYRLLADNSSDLIALKPTFGGPRSYVSPSSIAVVGYPPDELVRLPASDFVHPEDQERVAAEFASLTVDHPRLTSLHRVRHKEGHWIWTETDFRLINAGDPDQAVIVRARNVTRRHDAEQALAASERRYRILTEMSSDVVTQLDLSLHRRYVSPACRKLLGYEPAELLGARPSAKIHPDNVEEVRSLAARLAAGAVEGDRATTTYRTQHKQGHWVWVEATLNLLRHEGTGAPLSLICSLRDVTERQRIARHLKDAAWNAEQAARIKADFLANMSHELRTPLTGIIGVHDLLHADPNLSVEQRRLINLAADAGRSLLTIVNDVLDFSKIDAGQLVIESLPFNGDDLLTGCRDLARGTLGGKPLDILLRRHPEPLGHFEGDPTRVRQVLLNFLTNAVKFTAAGEITIDATYDETASTLRVEVADSGIGIPAEGADMLFDRFTQADSSMSRRYGGTGLGLAICKRLVELMGGQIGARRRPDGGSLFWFALPLARHAAQMNPRIETRSNPDLDVGLRILLAEDQALNAEIVTAMLVSQRHIVTHVADGAAAAEAARRDTFDLVLMDMQMPVVDGLSATRLIREREEALGLPRIPIVGLTANAFSGDARRCLDAGMDAHVAKPIDWPALLSTVHRLTKRERETARPDRLAAAGPAPAVLDTTQLTELSSVLGPDRLAGMLSRFFDDLRTTLAGLEGWNETDRSHEMHRLVSTSGQFGFAELSRICQDIHIEAGDGKRVDRLAEFREAVSRANEAVRRSRFISAA